MKLEFKLRAYEQGLIMALLAVVVSACSQSSNAPLVNRKTAATEETAESKELKELATTIEEYQKQVDTNGNVIMLPEYMPTPLLQDDGVLSAKDLVTNPKAEIFSYEAPWQADDVEYSMPVKLTDSSGKPLDVNVECKDQEYSPAPPRLQDLPAESGSNFVCIRLTHKSSETHFF